MAREADWKHGFAAADEAVRRAARVLTFERRAETFVNAVLQFLKTTLLGGLVVLLPAYVTVLLLLKTLGVANAAIEPVSGHLPTGVEYRTLVAIALMIVVCFAAGLFVRTAVGRYLKRAVERTLLERVPGYAVFRGLAEKLADSHARSSFAAALVVIEEALVPACIVERHAGGLCTVFVPSAPTPAVGAIYILPPHRVYEIDVPLVQLAAVVSKWGAGTSELLAKLGIPAAKLLTGSEAEPPSEPQPSAGGGAS